MMLGQFLTPEKVASAAKSLADQLNQFELQEGEMKPLMVLNPHTEGKIMINIITLKEEGGVVKYSRQLESKELSADFLMEMIGKASF